MRVTPYVPFEYLYQYLFEVLSGCERRVAANGAESLYPAVRRMTCSTSFPDNARLDTWRARYERETALRLQDDPEGRRILLKLLTVECATAEEVLNLFSGALTDEIRVVVTSRFERDGVTFVERTQDLAWIEALLLSTSPSMCVRVAARRVRETLRKQHDVLERVASCGGLNDERRKRMIQWKDQVIGWCDELGADALAQDVDAIWTRVRRAYWLRTVMDARTDAVRRANASASVETQTDGAWPPPHSSIASLVTRVPHWSSTPILNPMLERHLKSGCTSTIPHERGSAHSASIHATNDVGKTTSAAVTLPTSLVRLASSAITLTTTEILPTSALATGNSVSSQSSRPSGPPAAPLQRQQQQQSLSHPAPAAKRARATYERRASSVPSSSGGSVHGGYNSSESVGVSIVELD